MRSSACLAKRPALSSAARLPYCRISAAAPCAPTPGAPGIGAQGAAALIRQYGSLAALLNAGRFAKQAEDLKLYRSIATMDKKAPLPKIAAQTPTWHKAAALAREWQLNQLAGRLEEMARKPLPL